MQSDWGKKMYECQIVWAMKQVTARYFRRAQQIFTGFLGQLTRWLTVSQPIKIRGSVHLHLR